MSEHKITRVRGKGTDTLGYTDWEQVTCSCGYMSPKVANYNNYKHSMLSDFELNHLKRARLLEKEEKEKNHES